MSKNNTMTMENKGYVFFPDMVNAPNRGFQASTKEDDNVAVVPSNTVKISRIYLSYDDSRVFGSQTPRAKGTTKNIRECVNSREFGSHTPELGQGWHGIRGTHTTPLIWSKLALNPVGTMLEVRVPPLCWELFPWNLFPRSFG